MAVCSVNEALQTWNNHTILLGGFAWSCTASITASNPTPQPATLMRRITSTTAIDSTTLVIHTSDASPFDCFDELHLNVSMNHTQHNLSPFAMLPETTSPTAAPASGRFHPMTGGPSTFIPSSFHRCAG